MKVWFIFLSLLSAMLTWWWYGQPRLRGNNAQYPGLMRRLAHSVIAAVVVYFGLMAIAMVWLLLTTT